MILVNKSFYTRDNIYQLGNCFKKKNIAFNRLKNINLWKSLGNQNLRVS